MEQCVQKSIQKKTRDEPLLETLLRFLIVVSEEQGTQHTIIERFKLQIKICFFVFEIEFIKNTKSSTD